MLLDHKISNLVEWKINMQENFDKDIIQDDSLEVKDHQQEDNVKVVVKTKYPIWLIILCVLFVSSTLYFIVQLKIANNTAIDLINEKHELLLDQALDTVNDKNLEYYKARYEKIDELRDFIEENFYREVKDEDIENGVIRGLFFSLDDPYSTYFTKEEFKSFTELNQGSYGGLGITISPSKTGYITVISTFDDTPASRAGIKHNDKIIKVNGEVYTADKMDVAISKMKGKPGTTVNITILRDDEEIDMKLERAEIIIDSVKAEMLKEDDKIGYIRIRSFDQKVSEEFEAHYNELEEQGMKAFVIDLRGNPGGSLSECVKLTDFVLGEQRIVSTKNRQGEEDVFDSDASKIDIPFIVLVDGGSASASEIFSAAVQDGGTAKLLGTTTFGKGVVQTVIPLSDGSAFKVTTSEYFTPNGKNIHEKGVKPDIELKLSEDFDIEDRSTDNQLNRAVEILLEELNQ